MIDETETRPGRKDDDRKLVCVVEDDPQQLGEIADYLRQRGFRVLEITDGAVAVRVIGMLKPALVLMDIKMPGCDGVRAAEIARTLSPETMIVLMSGYPEEVARADKAGRISEIVVHKPVGLKELAHLVASVLGEALVENARSAIASGIQGSDDHRTPSMSVTGH